MDPWRSRRRVVLEILRSEPDDLGRALANTLGYLAGRYLRERGIRMALLQLQDLCVYMEMEEEVSRCSPSSSAVSVVGTGNGTAAVPDDGRNKDHRR